MFRGLFAAAVIVALARIAAADGSLDDARKAIDASDYMAARSELTAALATSSASPAELAEIFKLQGTVAAALNETNEATEAFAKWLALDPKAALPPGTSPRITRPFDAAAEKAKKGPLLKVKTETTADPPSVTLVVAKDTMGLVAKVRVLVKVDGGAEQTIDGKASAKIALPKGKRVDLRVVALDRHGNHVVELGSADVPIVIVGESRDVIVKKDVPPPPPGEMKPREPSSPRPLYAKWWLWGAVGGTFAVATTYFGIAARSATNELRDLNANSQQHTFTEAQAVEDRARRNVLLFNIGLGVTGACAIGAAILFITEPAQPTGETRITAIPTSEGGMVVVGGSF